MEETLGKRIAANRKRLGITQDRLADQLGVTAQAVSKWENDQSCPDITMLPKLAGVFGMSTDALLGIEPQPTEIVPAPENTGAQADGNQEPSGIHMRNGQWEFHWDTDRRDSVGLALWVLLVGGLMLAESLLHWDIGFWDILWPSGLLMFGLFGLYPKFSFFRLGCGIFGGYFLLCNLHLLNLQVGKELLLPVLLLIFGASLLLDAFRRKNPNSTVISCNGKDSRFQSSLQMGEDSFRCSTSFGEDSRKIELACLCSGRAEVSFGELELNLSGCEKISEDCRIDASCSFGDLKILVPRRFRVEAFPSTSFASVEFSGHPDETPEGTIFLNGKASFGSIHIQYI